MEKKKGIDYIFLHTFTLRGNLSNLIHIGISWEFLSSLMFPCFSHNLCIEFSTFVDRITYLPSQVFFFIYFSLFLGLFHDPLLYLISESSFLLFLSAFEFVSLSFVCFYIAQIILFTRMIYFYVPWYVIRSFFFIVSFVGKHVLVFMQLMFSLFFSSSTCPIILLTFFSNFTSTQSHKSRNKSCKAF